MLKVSSTYKLVITSWWSWHLDDDRKHHANVSKRKKSLRTIQSFESQLLTIRINSLYVINRFLSQSILSTISSNLESWKQASELKMPVFEIVKRNSLNWRNLPNTSHGISLLSSWFFSFRNSLNSSKEILSSLSRSYFSNTLCQA